MSEPKPSAEEIQTAYKVLEMIRDHRDETGLVGQVNTLNEAHSIVQEFEEHDL